MRESTHKGNESSLIDNYVMSSNNRSSCAKGIDSILFISTPIILLSIRAPSLAFPDSVSAVALLFISPSRLCHLVLKEQTVPQLMLYRGVQKRVL